MKLGIVWLASLLSVGLVFGGATGWYFWNENEQAISQAKEKGYVQIPDDSDSFEGKDYRDVYTRFKTAGFTHVKVSMLGDLITGFLNKKDTIDHVSVNGSDSFSKDYVPPESSVVLFVHSFDTSEKVDIDGYVDPQ